MERRRAGSRWILITGALTLLLGIIHCSLTSFIYHHMGIDQLAADNGRAFIWMYVTTGISYIFAGTMFIYCSEGLNSAEPWAWNISRITLVFTLLGEISSAVMLQGNPFAYFSLIIGFTQLLVLLVYRQEFRNTAITF